jgi:MFS family permease
VADVTSRLATAARRLVPPTGLSRRLAAQSVLFKTAEGTFMTGSAVFFTQVVGLSAAQVGLGLTLGAVAAGLTAIPSGRLVDRFGPKRVWALGVVVSALAFGAWPFIGGFGAYVAMVVIYEIVDNIASAGNGAYVLDVLPDRERVSTQAYMYSAMNVGSTFGAILGGIALAFDNLTVLRWLPLFTLALGLVNAYFITRLPAAPHDVRVARGDGPRETAPGRSALRNRGWLALSFFNGTMWTNQVLLNVLIPLWLVQETDSPHWLLAWLFGTNTVLCIFLPAYVSRGVNTIDDALRRSRISAVFFVASCVITLVTHSTVGLLTAALVWLGHITVTGAELSLSSASWIYQAKLMDPRRRGEYGSVAGLFSGLGGRWAPALYTFLAMTWHRAGWLMIGAIVVVATIGVHPAARAAQRFIDREVPEPRPEPEPSPEPVPAVGAIGVTP